MLLWGHWDCRWIWIWFFKSHLKGWPLDLFWYSIIVCCRYHGGSHSNNTNNMFLSNNVRCSNKPGTENFMVVYTIFMTFSSPDAEHSGHDAYPSHTENKNLIDSQLISQILGCNGTSMQFCLYMWTYIVLFTLLTISCYRFVEQVHK